MKIYAVEQPEKITRSPLAGPYYGWSAAERTRSPIRRIRIPGHWAKLSSRPTSRRMPPATSTYRPNLAAGMYRGKLETKDRFGKSVTAELPLQVLDPEAKKLNLKLPNLYAAPKTSLQPGEEFTAIWGSGYDSARAFVEVEHRGKLLQSYWTDAGDDASSHRATSQRSDARWIHGADDDGARESCLPAIATRRCSLDQQTTDFEMGTLRFEARASGKRNLDSDHQRTGCGTGCRRDGCDDVRRIARRLQATSLAERVRTCFGMITRAFNRSSRTS